MLNLAFTIAQIYTKSYARFIYLLHLGEYNNPVTPAQTDTI